MKLFSIIKTFNKKQWSGYVNYISLYHKPGSQLGKIALWLDEKAFWKVNKEIDYSAEDLLLELPFQMKQQTFSNAITSLGNIAEEYIGWLIWKDSPNLKRASQLKGLAQKSLSDEYVKTQKEIFNDIEKREISIWDDYYKMQALFNDYYFEVKPSDDNQTQDFKDLLFAFRKSTSTMAQLLMIEIKNRERLLSESWGEDKRVIEVLYQFKTDFIHISDLLIAMNHESDDDSYQELMGIIFSDKLNKYSNYIQYIISTYCTIYLTGIIKRGVQNRGQELLDLYEYSIEKGFRRLNDSIPLKEFINIIGVASKMKNYEWARRVVDTWYSKVDSHNQKSILIFGHATIDFYQQKYELVIDALSQMKTSNFQHRIRFRWLLLRAQYEINRDYLEVSKVQVENFRRFIYSNESRISKSTFEAIKTSIKVLKMLLNRKPIDQVESFYRSKTFVFERKWILQKIKNPV